MRRYLTSLFVGLSLATLAPGAVLADTVVDSSQPAVVPANSCNIAARLFIGSSLSTATIKAGVFCSHTWSGIYPTVGGDVRMDGKTATTGGGGPILNVNYANTGISSSSPPTSDSYAIATLSSTPPEGQNVIVTLSVQATLTDGSAWTTDVVPPSGSTCTLGFGNTVWSCTYQFAAVFNPDTAWGSYPQGQ